MTPTDRNRRRVLKAIAVTATGTLIPRAAFAQAGSDADLLPVPDVCTLMPETTEGPYYLDGNLVRRDIREDREGSPMLVRLQIVDTACRPVAGARVDIWHCDAQGVYSAYGEGRGETFLRGTQMADERGVAEFETVYPGWYPGRTVHIHYKVHLDERTVLTGQMFFPEEISQALYGEGGAYARNRRRNTMNANDGIARRATQAAVATVRGDAEAYLAQLIVGVDPAA